MTDDAQGMTPDTNEMTSDKGAQVTNAQDPDAAKCGSHHPSFGQNDLFPSLEVDWIQIDDLDDAPRRVRKALAKQIEAIKRSIERFGNRIPLLVDGKHHVIDGHARLAAARMLGAERMPCIVVDDLPAPEVRRLALSLNKLQEGGVWDDAALRVEIEEIIELTGEIEFPGWALPEIEAIRFGTNTENAPDPGDDLGPFTGASEAPVSKPGDVWCLGDHMVLCGSARNATALASLLNGQVADAVFTDAPYNVKISGNVRSASGGFKEFAEGSGEMSRDAFVTFLIEGIGAATACVKPGAIIFACMDWRHHVEIDEALQALGLELLNICVWAKTNAGMGSLYRSRHELVFVAREPGAGHLNNIQLGKNGRNRSNVWEYPGATGGTTDADDNFAVHPTVKPIRLVMDALLDVTAPDDLVLDPFLGSGTTLLAAERTGRCCAAVEIEPAYVDLCVCRWQAMTGRDAIHAKTGATFRAMAAAASAGSGTAPAISDTEGF